MARKQISLEFYDKKYTIEYNRNAVKEVLKNQKEDTLEQAIVLVKCGLQLHHANDMPSDDEIFGWLMAMGDDLKEFVEALQELIQSVLTTIHEDRKNLKWGKTEA